MAGLLSAAEVQHFVDEGFLVVKNLVGEEQRLPIFEDIDRFVTGGYKTVGGSESDSASPENPADILAVHFPHWVSPLMRSMISHPGIADVVGKIAAAHLAHWDGRAKCMQSMVIVKPPGVPGQAWHQEERFIPTRDRSLVGAWIALDDATVDNGCIWALPGSHRSGYLWPTRPHGRPEEFDSADEAYGFDETPAVPLEVDAGSVVFFNGYLLHRSFRNRGTGRRRALVNHYCNAWSLLPWAIPPVTVTSTEIPTLDFRAVVPLGVDPYGDREYSAEPDWVFLRHYDSRPAIRRRARRHDTHGPRVTPGVGGR